MNKARLAAASLPADLPVHLLFAAAAILLALLSLPQASHAQGIVRGAQEGSHEATALPVPWAALSEASSVPVSVAPLVQSRACSAFLTVAIAAAADITTAIIASIVIGEPTAVIPGRPKGRPGIHSTTDSAA